MAPAASNLCTAAAPHAVINGSMLSSMCTNSALPWTRFFALRSPYGDEDASWTASRMALAHRVLKHDMLPVTCNDKMTGMKVNRRSLTVHVRTPLFVETCQTAVATHRHIVNPVKHKPRLSHFRHQVMKHQQRVAKYSCAGMQPAKRPAKLPTAKASIWSSQSKTDKPKCRLCSSCLPPLF
jgi:hypothetical protein